MRPVTAPLHRPFCSATGDGDTAHIVDVTALPRPATTRPSPRRRDPFPYLVAAAALLVTGLYFARLGTDPPGVYDDEASIGYNAWTVAHFGVDQYGNHFPLFFADFGDYKGPVATYLTVPFAWFFGNSIVALRTPGVLAGLGIAVVTGLVALRLTRSRWIAISAALLTAVQPWVFLQSHTVLEGNVFLMLCVMVACWCVAEAAARERSDAWWTAAGTALGVAVFTYTIGRVLSALLAAAALVAFRRCGRSSMLRFLFPVAAAYVVLAAAAVSDPHALLARFQAAGLMADHPSLLAAAGRFIGNYASYFSPGFLVVSGDGNYRQTTGFGGVLLAVTLPLMIAGAVRLFTRRHEPYAAFALLGIVLAPVPAALTIGAPHALRGAGLFPFLVVCMIEGLDWARTLLASRRRLAAVLVLGAALTATPFFVDYFTAYPARASVAFQAGEGHGLAVAYARASQGSHRLFLSASLNQPAMQLMYAVLAPPPQDSFVAKAHITVVTTRPQLDAAGPGDVIVLAPHDGPPPGAQLLFTVRQGAIAWAPTRFSNADVIHVYVE